MDILVFAVLVVFGGRVGEKFDALVRARCTGEAANGHIYEETVNAFRTHYDDLSTPGRGYWQGEYWGKFTLSQIAGARYAGDAALERRIIDRTRAFVKEFQRADGYIGTYADAEFIIPKPPSRVSCWNLWGRKYTLWALLEVYGLSHDGFFLESAKRLYDQQLEMLARRGLKLRETGAFDGMPSLSVLKPLMLLHRMSGERKYLDSARELVAEMDDPSPLNPPPNLVRNPFGGKAVWDWYPPEPDSIRAHTKAYEMMSCYEGLVEYARVTGDRRVLEAAERFSDLIARDESNAMGSVGFSDGFCAAASRNNGINEFCDVIHWIRLSAALYGATGHARHLDRIELAFLNAGLAGFMRSGAWGFHGIRSHGHGHFEAQHEVGMKYHHCCLDNAPRMIGTMSELAVEETANGLLRLNFYHDLTAKLSDGMLKVDGNYPIGSEVVVSLSVARPRKLRLRVPGWCSRMTVDGSVVSGPFVELPSAAKREFRICFDMNPKVVMSTNACHPGVADNAYLREQFVREGCLRKSVPENRVSALMSPLRLEPAAIVRRGPLVLAKTALLGDAPAEMFDFESVNGKAVTIELEPYDSSAVWGAWKLRLKSEDKVIETRVSDLATAADDAPYTDFSVWF